MVNQIKMLYMSKKAGLLAILILLAIQLIVFNASLLAQTNEEKPGLDIVFIVDQSESMMFGSLQNPNCTEDCARAAPTDPDSLSLLALPEGLNPIFDRMLRYSVGRQEVGLLEEVNRYGLILFGTEEEVRIPLTEIKIQKDAKTNFVQPNIVSMLPKEPNPLGSTAPSRAFTAACKMLNCKEPIPPGRKRVVVFLTDGHPTWDEIGVYNPDEPERYFSQFREKHQALIQNSTLWILGLDASGQFWPEDAKNWKTIAPERTNQITNPQDIAEVFRQIAYESIPEPPNPPRVCDQTEFSVDPYLATLTLILEYPDVDSRAFFEAPDGTKLEDSSPNVIRYFRSVQSETFVIKNPQPGMWGCDIVGSSVTPKFRDIQGLFRVTKFEIERITGSESLLSSTCQGFTLSMSYLDVYDEAVFESPAYPLEQTATVTIDGESITRALVPDVPSGAEVDQWRLESPIQPSISGGTYPLSIEVQWDGNTIFTDTEQSVTITPDLPCMDLMEPTLGFESQMHEQRFPTDVEAIVELTQGGEPSTPEDVFKEPLDEIIKGQVQGPGDMVDPVVFAPLDDQPGQFVGRMDKLDVEGIYTLTVSLQGTTQKDEEYRLGPQSASFKRVESEEYLRLRRLFGMAFLGVGLLLLAGIIGFGMMITGPYPTGILVFEERVSRSETGVKWEYTKEINLNSLRFLRFFRPRWPTIKKKQLPPDSGWQAIKVRRLATKKKPSRASRKAKSKRFKPREQGIKGKLIRQKGKSSSIKFTKHDETDYSLGDKYRIRYENYALEEDN